MNINEQMHDLATMGGLAYKADDDLIASLVSRTRRTRAARQSVSTAASTLGAVALGLLATQVYAAAKDDPAFRDRNIINNNMGPVDKYRATYGNDNPTRNYTGNVNLDDIAKKLRESSANPKTPSAPASTPGDTKPATTTTKPGGSTGGGTGGTGGSCTAPGGGQEGMVYDCASGEWKVKDGYFMFGNGHVYQNIQWADQATGLTAWGNWSGTSWGWETKAIFTGGSTDKEYDYYVYMGSAASWSGNTCVGGSMTKWNANFKASCMPEWKVQAAGKVLKRDYMMKNDIVWILQDTYKKWCDCTGQFEDPANPPAGWMWDGTQWVSAPAPTP